MAALTAANAIAAAAAGGDGDGDDGGQVAVTSAQGDAVSGQFEEFVRLKRENRELKLQVHNLASMHVHVRVCKCVCDHTVLRSQISLKRRSRAAVLFVEPRRVLCPAAQEDRPAR